ncbi:MAG: ABC transporter permease [Spirochaetaceae bacterium]|nr:ABC transporter permease [Spirochaetaceae bacterium]
MFHFILRRVLQMMLILFLVSSAVFFMFKLVPGDVAAVRLGIEQTPEALAALRAQLGLDRPLIVQYLTWLGGLVRGDLGTSYVDGAPVFGIVASRFFITLELVLVITVLSALISIPVAVVAAQRKGTLVDSGIRTLSMVGYSLPTYWWAILLMLLFSVALGWLPAGGYVYPNRDFGRHLLHLILPTLAMVLILVAAQVRFLRASILDIIQLDYVRTARAKGLSSRRVLYKHVLRNSLAAFITVVGLNFATLIGGMVIIEQIFTWPGLGWLIITSILNRDFPVVQGAVLFVAAIFVSVNLAVDILYAALDPRIRYE